MEAQNLYKSDLLNIRLFLQTYLMENAKTERLKKLIKNMKNIKIKFKNNYRYNYNYFGLLIYFSLMFALGL